MRCVIFRMRFVTDRFRDGLGSNRDLRSPHRFGTATEVSGGRRAPSDCRTVSAGPCFFDPSARRRVWDGFCSLTSSRGAREALAIFWRHPKRLNGVRCRSTVHHEQARTIIINIKWGGSAKNSRHFYWKELRHRVHVAWAPDVRQPLQPSSHPTGLPIDRRLLQPLGSPCVRTLRPSATNPNNSQS
jgi:hypothetical protein